MQSFLSVKPGCTSSNYYFYIANKKPRGFCFLFCIAENLFDASLLSPCSYLFLFHYSYFWGGCTAVKADGKLWITINFFYCRLSIFVYKTAQETLYSFQGFCEPDWEPDGIYRKTVTGKGKKKVKAFCGSYSTAALRHIVLLPEWVPSFIYRGAAHTKRR